MQSVEKRAFQMARFATGQADEAMDLVQDAMLAFVRRYQDKPEAERRPLFFRVLQNRIRDWRRRRQVRDRWFVWRPRATGDEREEADPIDALPDPGGETPESVLDARDAVQAINAAIGRLPFRQQQAFLLRTWEELSVADTARAMGCSEGSVKTHHARAVQSLREWLKD
ncbi:MAG: RNA polymerase sigma factor, partial [Nitrospinaceae bacterium]